MHFYERQTIFGAWLLVIKKTEGFWRGTKGPGGRESTRTTGESHSEGVGRTKEVRRLGRHSNIFYHSSLFFCLIPPFLFSSFFPFFYLPPPLSIYVCFPTNFSFRNILTFSPNYKQYFSFHINISRSYLSFIDRQF